MTYNGTVTLEDPNLVTSFELDEQTTAYVVRDVDAEAPDWDGIGFVYSLAYDHHRGLYDHCRIAGDYGDTPIDVAVIREAWERFGDSELVARYLRMFHDALSVDYSDMVFTDSRVWAVVTRAQAEAWGLAEDPAGLAAQGLEVIRQWAEGEVYGVVVVDHETGEEESLWGVYGDENDWHTVAQDIAPIGVSS